MTTMAVLYLSKLGQPLGALSTTLPGDPPQLAPTSTLRVAVPVPDPLAGPPPILPILHSITVGSGDVAVAMVEAEFDDPLEVFQWRVVTTPGPGTTVQHRLDRVGTGQVTVTGTTSSPELLLDVPKLGNELELYLEIRNEAGELHSERLVFGTNDTSKTTTVRVDDIGDYVVLVKGYAPVVPVRLSVTRGGTGPNQGKELVLDVPKRSDTLRLRYEARRGSVRRAGDIRFATTDARKQVTVTLPNTNAFDVFVEGFPSVTVPAFP
jgi:hypothetical protein